MFRCLAAASVQPQDATNDASYVLLSLLEINNAVWEKETMPGTGGSTNARRLKGGSLRCRGQDCPMLVTLKFLDAKYEAHTPDNKWKCLPD